jgi:hypothetical protein
LAVVERSILLGTIGEIADDRLIRIKTPLRGKKVEVYYIVEEARIITVSIYVFFGKWEA